MKNGKIAIGLLSIFIMVFTGSQLLMGQTVKKPYKIVHLANRFGTVMYTEATAFEQIFKKSGSWIEYTVRETPGAMYNNKFLFQNKDKMKSGKMPPVITSSSASIMGYTNGGRPPFKKIPTAYFQAVFSSAAFVSLFMTFDSNIKSTKDLIGKKVGIPQKARIFSSTLFLKPYFDKGLGIWKKVDWQYIGAINSKDALLNDRIDARLSNFRAKVELVNGTYICTKLAPAAPALEILGSGKKVQMFGFDPAVIKKSYNFSKDMTIYPVLIKKGAAEWIKKDTWATLALGVYRVPDFLPREVVKELIRVRYEYRDELAKYHKALGLMPDNPYPLGVPDKWVQPEVKNAMNELGITIPK